MEAAGAADPEAAEKWRELACSMPEESPSALMASHVVDGSPSMNHHRRAASHFTQLTNLMDDLMAEIEGHLGENFGATVSLLEREQCAGADSIHSRATFLDMMGQVCYSDQYRVVGDNRPLTISFFSYNPEADMDVFATVMDTLTIEG